MHKTRYTTAPDANNVNEATQRLDTRNVVSQCVATLNVCSSQIIIINVVILDSEKVKKTNNATVLYRTQSRRFDCADSEFCLKITKREDLRWFHSTHF